MKDLSVLQLLSYLFFLVILFTSSATTATGLAVRADLTHVDSGRGFTKRELLRRMAARTRSRAAILLSCAGQGAHAHTVTAPVTRGNIGEIGAEYLIHFSIGMPRPQHVVLTLDTGSDLVWTQCEPCGVCFDQPFPVFHPSASNTFRGVACSEPICRAGGLPNYGCYLKGKGCYYLYSYGDNSNTAGRIIKDTFTFKAPNGKGGPVSVPEVVFGCGMFNTGLFFSNESGIAGFGLGPLSLPSQLKVGKFSYCFTTMLESKSSPVFLGTPDNLKAHATGPIQSTPFVRNPATPYYYLSLKGVTVGKTRLPVHESAFALKADGSGGTIIDSGTSITNFPQAVFGHLRSAFVSQVPLPVANSSVDADSQLCFSMSSAADAKKLPVPKLIFHLEGADLDLPRENYMAMIDEDGTSNLCLIISRSEGSDLTLIGNFQQQNMHIVYDLESKKLVFVPAQCDKL